MEAAIDSYKESFPQGKQAGKVESRRVYAATQSCWITRETSDIAPSDISVWRQLTSKF